MKKTIAALLFFIAVIAALPFINGIVMERAVHNVFNNVNSMYKDAGAGYSIEIISYSRGLYSSAIDWKISLGDLKPLYGIDEILVTERAKHGFTGVVSYTSLEKNPWFERFITEKLGGKNPFTIATTYSLFGKIESTASTTPFSFIVEGQPIDIGSGSAIVTTDRQLKSFISSGEWEGLSIADKFEFKETSFTSDLELLSTFLWRGSTEFSIAKLAIKEGVRQLDITKMKGSYHLDLDEAASRLSAQSSVGIAALSTGSRNIDGVTGTFSIKNMDAAGYEDFMKQYVEIVSTAISAVAESENIPDQVDEELEQQMTAAGLQIMAAYEKLMTKDLEISISDVHIKLPEGDLEADITLRLLKDMTLMQFAPVVGQPNLLLDIIYMKSSLTLPVGLVGHNPMLLEPAHPAMQTGIFIEDGNMLSHKSETKDGKLILNGKEVNLTQ